MNPQVGRCCEGGTPRPEDRVRRQLSEIAALIEEGQEAAELINELPV
ncbi:hypothetical protein [Streptomyces sp. NBRC 109706]|nr:hypothetical protein [Streptomyces sp. NBRC 109706]